MQLLILPCVYILEAVLFCKSKCALNRGRDVMNIKREIQTTAVLGDTKRFDFDFMRYSHGQSETMDKPRYDRSSCDNIATRFKPRPPVEDVAPSWTYAPLPGRLIMKSVRGANTGPKFIISSYI
ncbi:hypothetical protein J6590_103819 [Homalodisca vitripennis]|nr:hypothetical protein J6590_103819 [Homalodisca vitripennis]